MNHLTQNSIASVGRLEISEYKENSLRLLRLKHVCALMGVSRSTIYNWIREKSRWYIPEFPKPIRIGKTAIGWQEDEIARYLRQAPRAGELS